MLYECKYDNVLSFNQSAKQSNTLELVVPRTEKHIDDNSFHLLHTHYVSGSLHQAELPRRAAQVEHRITSRSPISLEHNVNGAPWNCVKGWQQSFKVGMFIPFLQPRKVSLSEVRGPVRSTSPRMAESALNPFDCIVWFPKASGLLPCHTVTCSQPFKLTVPPGPLRIAAQVEMLIDKVCLQGTGVGHDVPATQTLRAGCGSSRSPSSPRLSTWARGLMRPYPAASQTWSPFTHQVGCQTHHGRRPQRGAVIQRKKLLRETWVLFTALRQLQRKAFIADRRILFQSYSPGPLQQNNRTLVSIYLSCLVHMYFKHIWQHIKLRWNIAKLANSCTF